MPCGACRFYAMSSETCRHRLTEARWPGGFRPWWPILDQGCSFAQERHAPHARLLWKLTQAAWEVYEDETQPSPEEMYLALARAARGHEDPEAPETLEEASRVLDEKIARHEQSLREMVEPPPRTAEQQKTDDALDEVVRDEQRRQIATVTRQPGQWWLAICGVAVCREGDPVRTFAEPYNGERWHLERLEKAAATINKAAAPLLARQLIRWTESGAAAALEYCIGQEYLEALEGGSGLCSARLATFINSEHEEREKR